MSNTESLSFCTSTNFKSAAVYLSQELQNLGLKYKIIEANGEKINLVSLVNNCWDLIQMYHSSLKENRNLHEDGQKDMADLNYLKTAVKELRGNIKDSERRLKEAQEKERQLNVVNKAFASKVKTDKDEVKRLSSVLQQKDIQHQHESKKLELSITKLKDRISKLISNDRNTAIPSIRMSSSLDKNQGIRGRWKTEQNNHSHEAELYQKVFSRYEAWISQLVDETESLKELLADVGQKLATLSNKCATMHLDSFVEDKDLLNGSLTSSVFHSEATENAIFPNNFTSGKDLIRKNFEDHFYVLERALQFDVAGKNLLNKNPETCQLDVEAEFIAEGLCVEQKAQLLEEHKKLHDQRSLLQVEREKFAAAAIRLNREKAEFEVEKVELLRQQFLSELPPQSRCNENQTKELDETAASEITFWRDFLEQSPNKNYVVPCITSPMGNIRLNDSATFLGPSTLRQPLRTIQRLSKTCVCTPTEGLSLPSTRPTSLNRKLSSVSIERKCHTLETRDGTSNLNKSTSRSKDRLSLTFPRISTFDSTAMHVISSPTEDRAGTGLRRSIMSEEFGTCDELYSLDSGISPDCDEADIQVGKRLTVLEYSLVSLLNKIDASKELKKGPSSTFSTSCKSESDHNTGKEDIRLSTPTVNRYMTNSSNSPIRRKVARSRPSLPSKLISGSSNLFPNRKSKRDKS